MSAHTHTSRGLVVSVALSGSPLDELYSVPSVLTYHTGRTAPAASRAGPRQGDVEREDKKR